MKISLFVFTSVASKALLIVLLSVSVGAYLFYGGVELLLEVIVNLILSAYCMWDFWGQVMKKRVVQEAKELLRVHIERAEEKKHNNRDAFVEIMHLVLEAPDLYVGDENRDRFGGLLASADRLDYTSEFLCLYIYINKYAQMYPEVMEKHKGYTLLRMVIRACENDAQEKEIIT